MTCRSFPGWFTLFFALFSCGEKSELRGGLLPDKALQRFQLPEGFQIELVASEPLVADPVAMEVDEYGNLFVVEMHGYPLDTSGSGKIRRLEDTDADGLPDKATLFADHLKLPTGIMRWKKGWLVVDVPDILYLEDRDQDGKADVREVVLTGMALTNPQHITNTPIYGIDNWIYVAHMGIITPKVSMMFNDTGSLIRFPGAASAASLPRNADGRNFRFRPDTRELEMLAGESQYGHTFDNWGRHFCVANADHVFHEVIGARYLRRNPDLLVADASDYISDHGDACAVFPITHNPENQLLTDRGVVTSACGITFYNGGLFPDSFRNVSFTAEPTSNIVHADRIRANGATFTASRVYENREFLASTDGWFRPVQMYIGPDGALYVIDYYRQIIEHPEWLSEEVIQSGALYNGSGQGRIYRITPTGTRKMDWLQKIRLGDGTIAELVQQLSSPNIWWRRQSQRLLMDRRDPEAIPLLRKMADTTASSTAFLHAFHVLEGLGAMDSMLLAKGLLHAEAGVRENALQVAEGYLARMPGLVGQLHAMRLDPDPRVRFQLMCTLGDLDDAGSRKARLQLLLQDVNDRWMQVAALSGSAGQEWALLEQTLPVLRNRPSEGGALFFGQLAGLIGLTRRGEDIARLIQLASRPSEAGDAWWQSALLTGLGRGLGAKGVPANSFEAERNLLLAACRSKSDPEVRDAALDLLRVLGPPAGTGWNNALLRALETAADSTSDPAERVASFKLIALQKEQGSGPMVASMLGSSQDLNVQEAAMHCLHQQAPAEFAQLILKRWGDLAGPLKEAGMNLLLETPEGMQALLGALEQKSVASADIPWRGKVDLMNHDDAAMRNRARALLAGEIEGREKVVTAYAAALEMRGEIRAGANVFQQVCGACHTYEGKMGLVFGPDLGSIRNRDKSSIMTDILQPNRSIAVQYDLWTVFMKNGSRQTGIIRGETPTTIELAPAAGRWVTIARAEIARMDMGKTSAMPEGLENALSVKQMADLLAFITQKE